MQTWLWILIILYRKSANRASLFTVEHGKCEIALFFCRFSSTKIQNNEGDCKFVRQCGLLFVHCTAFFRLKFEFYGEIFVAYGYISYLCNAMNVTYTLSQMQFLRRNADFFALFSMLCLVVREILITHTTHTPHTHTI